MVPDVQSATFDQEPGSYVVEHVGGSAPLTVCNSLGASERVIHHRTCRAAYGSLPTLQRQVPTIQKLLRTVEVPQVHLIDKAVCAPMVLRSPQKGLPRGNSCEHHAPLEVGWRGDEFLLEWRAHLAVGLAA